MNKAVGMHIVRYVLIFLTILALLVLVPSSISLAAVQPIPLDQAKMEKVDPAFYLSETEYQDESLHVVIGTGRVGDTNYMTATVKIQDASQIRSALASPNGKGASFASTLAKRVNAVLAVNGDYYMFHASDPKHVVRQGVVKKHNANGSCDALIIDENGDFTIIPRATEADFDAFNGQIVNCYAFGPGLVINGELITEYVETDIAPEKQAKRICIAQTGELEYLIVASEGPEENKKSGLTIVEFATLVHSLGVQNAYNLDGGSSATIVFNNKKIYALSNPKTRQIADIIFFASAYTTD